MVSDPAAWLGRLGTSERQFFFFGLGATFICLREATKMAGSMSAPAWYVYIIVFLALCKQASRQELLAEASSIGLDLAFSFLPLPEALTNCSYCQQPFMSHQDSVETMRRPDDAGDEPSLAVALGYFR